jgi:hypothetical protein
VTADDAASSDSDDGENESTVTHRKIPNWPEAISVVVESNLAGRGKQGSGRSGGGRSTGNKNSGGRRSRGRKGKPQEGR